MAGSLLMPIQNAMRSPNSYSYLRPLSLFFLGLELGFRDALPIARLTQKHVEKEKTPYPEVHDPERERKRTHS